MQPIPQQFKLGLVEPRDASAAFERKGWLLPSFRWQDTYREDHARGVAVAGVMKLDVLQAFADELQATIDAGGDLASFMPRMQAVLEKKGMWGDVEITDPRTGELRTTKFDKRRLQLIFDVNVRQAFAAGRWKRIEAGRARKPFVMYRTMQDERVRLTHRQWDGLVLPIENDFWDEHYPPNGWRCRCTAFAVSEKDIARYAASGTKINRQAPEVVYRDHADRSSGLTHRVPNGIDPGFDYNPGKRLLAGIAPREMAPGVLRYPNLPLPALGRLPAPRPIAADMLMAPGLPEQDYLDAFVQMFGGQETFVDVTGEQLVIGDEFFKTIDGQAKVTKRGRERFVKLIALTLQRPDEIWMLAARHVARQQDVVRRRYVARFLVEGEPNSVLAILELGKDGWVGKSGYQAEAAEASDGVIASARIGELVYARVQ
jgi:SPP1 gp7 family putative phage head morphogenesis protein